MRTNRATAPVEHGGVADHHRVVQAKQHETELVPDANPARPAEYRMQQEGNEDEIDDERVRGGYCVQSIQHEACAAHRGRAADPPAC